jgi:DNA-binding response OmpR family regulator
MRILIVEDDKALAEFISCALSTEGHTIEAVNDGAHAHDRVMAEQFDLILLDLNLPGRDGVEILTAARRAQRAAAIMVVTGRTQVADRVHCLDSGADDCLVKPFAVSELVARTRALARRSRVVKDSVLYCGDLVMDRVNRTVHCAGISVNLTATEFSLAEFLLLHKGECVQRGQLLQNVWKMPADSDSNIVDVYINYLRRKLSTSSAKSMVQTVRGEGYVMREWVETAAPRARRAKLNLAANGFANAGLAWGAA